MKGTKYGCGEGQCGACAVLIDAQPRLSCVTDLSTAESREITTIEGLATDGHLQAVQGAFLEVGAFKCGYCTPGMILSGVALLKGNSDPGEPEIVLFVQDNVCRCGTYPTARRRDSEGGQFVEADCSLSDASNDGVTMEPARYDLAALVRGCTCSANATREVRSRLDPQRGPQAEPARDRLPHTWGKQARYGQAALLGESEAWDQPTYSSHLQMSPRAKA